MIWQHGFTENKLREIDKNVNKWIASFRDYQFINTNDILLSLRYSIGGFWLDILNSFLRLLRYNPRQDVSTHSLPPRSRVARYDPQV